MRNFNNTFLSPLGAAGEAVCHQRTPLLVLLPRIFGNDMSFSFVCGKKYGLNYDQSYVIKVIKSFLKVHLQFLREAVNLLTVRNLSW